MMKINFVSQSEKRKEKQKFTIAEMIEIKSMTKTEHDFILYPLIHKRYICDGKLYTPMKIKIKKYLLKCYFYSSIDNGNKKSF